MRPDLNIRDLQAVVAVAEERSISRAAERLFITPSPLSRRIGDLEVELGFTLFRREHHILELTDHGTEFVQRAAHVLQLFDAIVAPPESGVDGSATTLRVGVSLACPPTVIDNVLDELAQFTPALTWTIEFGSTAELNNRLLADTLDLAVGHLPMPDLGLRWSVLESYRLKLLVRSGDPLSDRDVVTFGDLVGREVVVSRWQIHPRVLTPQQDELRRAGVTRLVEMPTSDPFTIANYVLRTGAVSMSSDWVFPAFEALRPACFKMVPLQAESVLMHGGVVWNPAKRVRSQALRKLTARFARQAVPHSP